METPVVKSRGRPRKRPREDLVNGDDKIFDGSGKEDVQNTGNPRKRGRPPKKKVVQKKVEAMVERYVLKEFGGNGVFLGKIVSYDSGLYRVDYEDGDREDLDSGELRQFVISDEQEKFVGELLERKKRLDEAIDKRRAAELKNESENGVKLKDRLDNGVKLKDVGKTKGALEVVFALEKVDPEKVRVRARGYNRNAMNDVGKVEVSALGDQRNDCDIDVDNDNYNDYSFEEDDEVVDDSSSDSMEYGQGWETRAETEIPDYPPPELPPSSGTVGVPEEYMSNLFSVYGFLRTFNIHLFLSPFTLDDLVGCLNCKVPNTLLDAIHVVLLRVLRRHLEGIAPEESQLAPKCLRSIDWGLLDYLTWPVYLFHYLMVMGRLDGKEWKGFYVDVLDKDYCTLSIGTKLAVLQILCDDALDTEEIRSEIDRRVESEVGVDPDGILSNHFESGFESATRTMYPRSSKTFAGKYMDNEDSAVENGVVCSSKTVKSDAHNRDLNEVGEDGNVDECRLCGMEGMLVCCDGCPSAYHSRCIGVNKLSIPDGKWFCPECTISKIRPPIITGTSLRGAEVFGLDAYAQLFLGSCNHLLVLKVPVKASSFVRYYHYNDIPKVMSALVSSPNHALCYLGICQSISKYWGLPEVVLPPLITNQASMLLENKDENRFLPLQSHPCNEQTAPYKIGNETYASSAGESVIGNASGIGYEKSVLNSGSEGTSFGAPLHIDPRSMADAAMKQYAANKGETVSGHNNGVFLQKTHSVHIKEDRNRTLARSAQKNNTFSYMGSIFKPFAYINNYVHGAFAASAAANFEGLSSNENQASVVHSSDPRKAMAANVSLQVKAFSSAAVRFFWPSTEKKLVEIPRERCSWCFHCKAPVVSKKACLLNQAALNATRAEMKFVLGLRLVKIVDGGLYGIAAYTLYMEESLRGFQIGPFRSLNYREQWRKKVEQASTCSEMKSLLLDLERNLCTITLTSEWTKLVDNWMNDSSGSTQKPQSIAASGTTRKRGPGRRKKHLVTPQVNTDDSNDADESIWWRGGKLAKLVFQRGTLPRGILRKAARQGGSWSLPGISYADGSDVPKRSRQLLWRAAVEMAKNASQLALQVRYLDQHIKWSDLVRPDQISGEGKGLETDALAFRNAKICDKKIFENKNVYGVVFGHQKHLSSRLMKSIIEKEEREDGEDKYWLHEARIPLYLIKEYEENADKTDIQEPSLKLDRYSKHQRKQLRASRKEIFKYLERKKEGLQRCICASCRVDVLLEQSVTCNSCEGFCHKKCMLSSTEITNEDIEFRVICGRCSNSKIHPHLSNNVESPTSPLAMQGQELQNTSAVVKSGKLKSGGHQHQNSITTDSHSEKKPSKSSKKKPSTGTLDSHSEKKPSKWSKKKPLSGVIWKKKDSDDGNAFLLNNIIHRSSPEGLTLNPDCQLCGNPYSPFLMYIRCEVCQYWHHADAVNVDESKLPNIVGYKCCRCRRIRSKVCPFADDKKTELPVADVKKPEVKKLRIKGPKELPVKANSVSEAISEQMESLPSTPMSLMEMEEDVLIGQGDPLVLPISQVQQMPESSSEVDFEWNPFAPGPQKLPVRRLMKNENDNNGLTWTDHTSAQLPTSVANQKLPVRRLMKNEKDENGLTWSEISSAQLPTSVPNQKLPVRRHMKNEEEEGMLTCIDLSSSQLPTLTETNNFPDPNPKWDVGDEDLADGTTLNNGNLNFENDFEPQTYFSFTELLEADNSNHLGGGVDASKEAWQDLPCESSQNGFMEQCKVTSFDELVPQSSIEPVVDVLCEVCQEAAPTPDLACITCGIRMHLNCSPWEDDEEENIQGDNWSCGQCREFGGV